MPSGTRPITPQMATISECRSQWLRVPATTFIITHSPSRSNRRDGFSFSGESGIGRPSIRADLVSVRNWCRCVGVGLVPGIGEALGFRTGRRGLARFEGIERTAAPIAVCAEAGPAVSNTKNKWRIICRSSAWVAPQLRPGGPSFVSDSSWSLARLSRR